MDNKMRVSIFAAAMAGVAMVGIHPAMGVGANRDGRRAEACVQADQSAAANQRCVTTERTNNRRPSDRGSRGTRDTRGGGQQAATTTTAPPATTPTTTAATAPTTTPAAPTTTTTAAAPTSAVSSDYLGSYTLDDAEFGTEVTVTVSGSTRTIAANALPDHDTGQFPNAGNPNTISAQSTSYSFPVNPTYVGAQTEVRTTGVAVNGVKFEPGTAETVDCASGESLRVEALQDIYNLGLDFNNAHVQPTGEYHYHGASEMLALAAATDGDLVHVGFAADGYLIYYSKSGAYESGYELSNALRTGTNCTGSSALGGASVAINGSTPDGTYTSDWNHNDANGDLDACNGTTIDGTYAYLVTDEFPYIGRCLNGQATGEAAPAGGAAPTGGTPRSRR